MTDNKNKRVGFSRNLPSGLSTFHLEADSSSAGLRITLWGIIGVNHFNDEGVLLSSHSGRISVSGKKLKLEVYENKIIEISGMIEEICFGKKKN